MAPATASSGRIRPWLVVGDLVLAVLWVCAGALVKLAVYNVLGLGGRPEGEAAKVSLSVVYMFIFAWLESATGGASYNPLTAISGAVASRGGPALYLFTVFVRVPAQVIGAVIGVMLMRFAFPKVGKGVGLSVGVHHGALTEGLTTLLVVMVSVTLKKKEQGFFIVGFLLAFVEWAFGPKHNVKSEILVAHSCMASGGKFSTTPLVEGVAHLLIRTWIASIWKMTIHILSSDITGGIMNPASAFAWAYARGDHTSFDHLLVYWLAPLQATLLAVWVVTFLTKPKTKEQKADENKNKKE